MLPLQQSRGNIMSKVLKGNVILKGREFKAGTKESELPAHVKKDAVKFLIDEKKYTASQQKDGGTDSTSSPLITELESLLSTETTRADNAVKALSQANSDVAGLTSQLEDAGNSEELQDRVTELETSLEESGAKVTELETSLEESGAKVTELETSLEESGVKVTELEDEIKKLIKATKK